MSKFSNSSCFFCYQPLSGLPGSWENNRYAASITLHSSDSWENLWLMVHDSMMPMFEEYLNDVETNEEEGTEDNAEGQKKELRLEEVAVAPVTCAFDVVISGNYAYIADWEDGLVIVDISIQNRFTIQNQKAPV